MIVSRAWIKTGELLPDGRPLWKCPSCNRKIWGHKVAPHQCEYALTPTSNKKFDAKALTLCITHFDRPEHLQRCIASIRAFYPDVPIVVGDNSVNERPTVPNDVRLLIAEPDCGLSALRNKLVAHADTPNVAILEEDFLFTEETDLGKLTAILDDEPTVGIAAGSLWTDGVLHNWSRVFTKASDGKKLVHDKSGPYNVHPVAGLWQTCDVVLNFFVARTEVLKANPWPEEIKINGEHYRWFSDLHDARITSVVHVPAVKAVHDKSQRTEHYQSYRRRKEWNAANNHLIHDGGAAIGSKRPNLVILGVGHSGTTILSKILAALGWHVPQNDADYFEPINVRKANQILLSGNTVDCNFVLDGLRNGWLLKDPRFVVTLPEWITAFAESAARCGASPTLIYIKRNLDDVLASYRRRGENVVKNHGRLSIQDLHSLADRRYQEWPWEKVQVRYEDIASAVGLWDSRPQNRGAQLSQMGCCGSPVTRIYECDVHGACTDGDNETLEWQGLPVASCLGCKESCVSAKVSQ